MRGMVNTVIGLLTVSYPVAVYFGVRYVEPWTIAAILVALLLGRLMTLRGARKGDRWFILVAVSLCVIAVWQNDVFTLRFYPVLINLGLLTLFSASLSFPPPVIERLARRQHPDLPPEGVIYTRKVTQIWSVFFLLNGLMAAVTAVWSNLAFWSLYNGLIAYGLMGLLMGGEYLVRITTQDYVH